MIPVTNLRPFTRMLMTIGQIPTSYLISMSYEEQVLWFCNYLEKTVIPAIDNNAEAVKELQDLFVELKSYVDNYFDNLDVQEEINNKLDEMAESGQLADIIAQYLGLAGVLAYDTISDMASATNINEGSICKTLGETTYNDGKGAFYKVRTITSSDVIDGVNIVALDVSNTLIAERIIDYNIEELNKLKDYPINVLLHGVKGDGITDDTLAIQSLIDNNSRKTLYFPDGNYLISSPLTITQTIEEIPDLVLDNNAIIFSNTSINSLLKINGDGLAPSRPYRLMKRHYIKGGTFDCNNEVEKAIEIDSTMQLITLENINIINVNGIGIHLKRNENYTSNDALINSISISGKSSINDNGSTGILIDSFDNEFNNIRIQGVEKGVVINGGGNKFYNTHVLYIGHTEPSLTLYEKTIAFLINSGENIFNNFIDCYNDTMCNGFKITNASIINILNGFMNSYIEPIQEMNSSFVWIVNSNANVRLENCEFNPASRTGITYIANNIRVEGDQYHFMTLNKVQCVNCNWKSHSMIPDNDLSYALRVNKKFNQTYTIPYSHSMEANKYYKVGLINTGQGTSEFIISNASDGTWKIKVNWSGGGTQGSASLSKEIISTPTHNFTLSITDTFLYNGIRYGYLCVKTSDNNVSLNTSFCGFNSPGNTELICGFEKYGLAGYTPSTIVSELSLN